MSRTRTRWSAAPIAAVVATLLIAAGCGDLEVNSKASDDKSEASPTPSPAKVDTSAGEGNWLLGISSAAGADAETNITAYVTYNPSTGQATARELPGVQAGTTTPEQAALLVSADRHWAIPDIALSRGEEKSGKLKVYSLVDGATEVVDIRDRTGKDDVTPIAWAFDPKRADTLRVVDTKNRVWVVNVAGGKATQESKLPNGPWVFTNGFNPNTGTPWVESITSDKTKPRRQRRRVQEPGRPRGWHRAPQRFRRPLRAAHQPVPRRRRLHRRRRGHLGLLRGPAGRRDLLPAQGRQGVDRLRQAEHSGGTGRIRLPARAASTP